MNRAAIANRIKAASVNSKCSDHPVMRCWLSDGSIKDMHILEACTYNRGELINNKVVRPEVTIVRTECIKGEDKAPELVKICQLLISRGI